MKTETKVSHTPGPWEISYTASAIDGEEDILIEQQGCLICTVRGTNDMSCIDEDDLMAINDEVILNAKLIAAAPELLEALQAAKACMERDKNCGYRLDYNGKPAHEVGSTYLKVCNAIEKATV